MKKLKIKNKVYTCPESWEDITIRMQMDFERLYEQNKDLKKLAIIAGYFNLPFEEVSKLHFNEIKQLYENLSFTLTPIPVKTITEFQFKGETYSVIPSLEKGEVQDFLSFENQMESNKEDIGKALPFIVAIYAKRKTEKGYESLTDYDYQERGKLFLDLPLTIADNIRTFFFSNRTDLYTRLRKQNAGVKSDVAGVDAEYDKYQTDLGWWSMVFEMCSMDVTKMDQVLTEKLERILWWSQLKKRRFILDKNVNKLYEDHNQKKAEQDRLTRKGR